MPKTKSDPQQKATAEIRRLLEDGFVWPEGLNAETPYERIHDDNDGDREGVLLVSIDQFGDAYLMTDVKFRHLRFRNSIGGGMSLRVNNALKILALAIKLDNEERPQR